MLQRREWLKTVALGTTLPAFSGDGSVAAKTHSMSMTLGFGTYGMKSLKLEDAIRTVADIGYDGLEIATMPDWDSAPDRMSRALRADARNLIGDSKLTLTSLMQKLTPSANRQEQFATLESLKRTAELGHDLSPDHHPVIQTVLGGGTWGERKAVFRDRLADWVKIGEKTNTVICIKPHRGGAMSRPIEAAWLIDQLGKPRWLRMVYDYSHYAFRDMAVEQTVTTALPYTAHIAVKDATRHGGRVQFTLPGETDFDYVKLLRLLHDGGYRGDVCCEVSGMIWSRPGYDPVAAAGLCYGNLAKAFEQAGIRRSK